MQSTKNIKVLKWYIQTCLVRFDFLILSLIPYGNKRRTMAKIDFSLPFVQVNKKYENSPSPLDCWCCLLFNDDSPIQIVSYVCLHIFNIIIRSRVHPTVGGILQFRIIQRIFYAGKFYISVSINFKCSWILKREWEEKYFMEYGFSVLFMFWDEWVKSTRQKRCSIW